MPSLITGDNDMGGLGVGGGGGRANGILLKKVVWGGVGGTFAPSPPGRGLWQNDRGILKEYIKFPYSSMAHFQVVLEKIFLE